MCLIKHPSLIYQHLVWPFLKSWWSCLWSLVLFNLSLNLYIYIYIYCHPQTDCFVVSQLFSVARHARFSKLGSKHGWLIYQPKILPHSYKETSISEGILNSYVSLLFVLFFLFTYIRLTATESLTHSKSLALHKWQPLLLSPESSTPQG